MIQLIIATRNLHKVREIRSVLSDTFDYFTLQDFPQAPAVVEDAGTFAGNAAKKALELARWISRSPNPRRRVLGTDGQLAAFCLADDSGLEVDALGGAPGVHSARFAAEKNSGPDNSPDSSNNTKLLRLLEAVSPDKRSARFRCVLALAPLTPPDRQTSSPVCYADETELGLQYFEGVCEGQIQTTARGVNGFGYDPLFVPVGHDQSFAELGEGIKNRISHRAQALRRLAQWFKGREKH